MSTKSKNLNIRISEEKKKLICRAARFRGLTISSFVLQAVLKDANKILAEERRIVLSKQDMVKLLELLNEPQMPNRSLQEAYQKFEKNFQ